MPSPFPGMNPYLERDVAWHDFHERFLVLGAGIIGAQIRPHFIVRVDQHVYVREVGDESRRPVGRADLALLSTPRADDPAVAVAMIEAPARVRLPEFEVEHEAFLEIRDRHLSEVVTIVELLSPANKRPGPWRRQYLADRAQILASPAHLVEIDLLRGGEPMPSLDRPPCAYSVLVSRPGDRPQAGFWPINLRDRLPTIAIPVRPPHPDARFDLQALLHRVYDEAGYELEIYEESPQPPLSPDDAAWARQLAGSVHKHA